MSAPAAERRRRWLPLTLGVLAAASLLLEYGFRLEGKARTYLEGLDLAIAAVFGLELLYDLVTTRGRALRRRWHELVLLTLFLAALPAVRWLIPTGDIHEPLGQLGVRSAARLYIIVVQVYLLAGALVQFVREQEGLLTGTIRPERLFVGGFAGLVLLGTGLLLLPGARAGAAVVGPLDAFFTATSAVCVTGLATLDTGGDFTVFGQLVILFLFQIGGLGIVTFVALSSVSSRGAFSVPQLVALRELLNAPNVGAVRRQLFAIVLTAFVIETLGAVLLFTSASDPATALPERLHWSVFHSVSAFCNAGFALSSDSLTGLSGHVVANLTFMGLIVIGGLGAPVIGEMSTRAWRRLRPPADGETRAVRYSAQTRLALASTAFLILAGALGIALFEWNGVLRDAAGAERVLLPLFESVTARTAGFNTCDTGALREPTLLLVIVLMVVGACPVSTGGGVKTIAVAVLFLTLRSMITGRKVEVFGRTVPERVVRASISIFLLYLGSAVLVLFVLSITDPHVGPTARAFETFSALSTVGLSTGITAELSAAGKLVLCLAMFAGRVGPLTLAMTVFRARSSGAYYDLPEEAMVVG